MDNSYRKLFLKKKTLFVVIHVFNDLSQVLENVRIAIGEGADGVFLINHSPRFFNWEKLWGMLVLIKGNYINFNIGLNFLDLSARDAIKEVPLSAFGLWVDNAMVCSSGKEAKKNWQMRNNFKFGWDGLYFGGVAFKYQDQPVDLENTVKMAVNYMDVITTSGDATGEPPSIEKIRRIRKSIGNFPLAIASGMTPENVREFTCLADCFLVSTGINYDFYNLNPQKVADFVKKIS